MFRSWQTFEGFKITADAVVEVTKLLFSENVAFFLMERFLPR